MTKYLLVALGGAIGSVVRFTLSNFIAEWAQSQFPLGTLVINVLGCFVIGAGSYWAESNALFTPEVRALFFAGFLGGFTTFSTFGNETLGLWRNGLTLYTLVYLGAHIVLGLGAVWLGRTLAMLGK